MNSLDKMEDYDRLAAALAKEKAKNKELRRKVAMLRKELILCAGAIASSSLWALRKSVSDAINNTQATAEAYEREVEMRGGVKALDGAAAYFTPKHKYDCWHTYDIQCRIKEMIEELRANKGKEVV